MGYQLEDEILSPNGVIHNPDITKITGNLERKVCTVKLADVARDLRSSRNCTSFGTSRPIYTQARCVCL